MDYTVAPVLLLLAVIVPTKTLQASLIMRYTAENTAMHNNVPRKGAGVGGATLCSGRHKRKVLLAHLTTRPRKWLIKLGGSLCTVSGHVGKGASLLSAKA